MNLKLISNPTYRPSEISQKNKSWCQADFEPKKQYIEQQTLP